ncbi:hypothetical protein AGMMS50239_12390 [Bacteroidia bacterium]|nr:hypothetical protein AGMMS50239_12390 [Bacteroidia bacterium]
MQKKNTDNNIKNIEIQSEYSYKAQYTIQQLLLYLQYSDNKFNNIPVKKIEYENLLTVLDEKREEKTVNLSAILQGEKVILYFTQLACNSCISEQFVLLDKLRRKIGKERILLLADYVRDDVAIYLKSNKINLDIYEFGDKDIGLIQ